MTTPKLRFKEFDADWNSVSLLDISALVTKGTTPKQFINGDINFLKIEAITQSGFDLSKCQTINSEIHNKELKRSILKEGDILFAIAGATIGKNAIVQKELLPANTNQALAIIRLKENYSKVFISKVLNSPLMEKYIDINISTGAQPNLNLQQIGSFSFALPKLNEQIKIASFLSAVDEKITQLTQKHQLLSQYKQGMMQKLFSQQIRFKADDGSEFEGWEIQSLGNISTHIGGTALESYVDESGTYNFISIGNYSVNGKYIDNSQRIVLNQKTASKLLNKDDLVMVLNDKTASGDLIGSTILINEDNKYIYNQRSERIICNHSNVIPIYLWHFLNAEIMRSEVRKLAQGGTQIYINFGSVLSINFFLPCLEEQAKIANFLSAIDQKLDAAAEQLEQAKTWKKGLLQQMFV